MNIILVSSFVFLLSAIYCYDSESSESNRIEVNPFYDTIIYSDIADIINDFGNNGVSPFDMFASLSNSESQSDEAIDNLLSEYQHYLEKAHKQRKNYMEKSKTKNKVPLLPRHDQYTKVKSGVGVKHDEYLYANSFYNPSSYKLPPTSYGSPLDVFIPVNSKGKHIINKPGTTTILPKENREELLPFEKIMFNEKKIMDLSPVVHKSSYEPIKSSCYCKNNQFPCDCGCKQCLVRFEPMLHNPMEQMKMRSMDDQKKNTLQHSSLYENFNKKTEHSIDDNMKEMFSDNALNIRIKIDLELPKPQDIMGKYYKVPNRDRMFEQDDLVSKELTNGMNLPFPYFNFPVPMELFGYKKAAKYSKDDSPPLHKITIHKKKKSRNNNKKHRKKVITFHNIKVQQQPLFPNHIKSHVNISNTIKNETNNNVTNDTNLRSSNVLQFEINSMINKTDDILNETQTEESLYLMVNITNNSYNGSEDIHKIENSIETDLPRKVTNVTTAIREKRDLTNVNETTSKSHSAPKALQAAKNNMKKADKNLLSDVELLYWPNVTRSMGDVKSKNITTMILENEHKKSKLNMSKDTIRQNRTRVLEQAIFGDVDWDDVATVAPAFMSFVGKYIRGVLTFCSEKVCHSMNCANKTCLHRVCVPSDRLNNRGHCAGTNSTDSVASMESIMDLPSNVAFEIVDILQNKMLGKIFGKATFCINAKCITLVASKKNFAKSRCSIKELNTAGHCSNVKAVKVILVKETYLNPWKTTNNPKVVVEFDSNGDLKLKDISKDHIISVIPIIEAMRDKKNSFHGSRSRSSRILHLKSNNGNTDTTGNLDKFLQEFRSMLERKKTRLKVLTLCNKINTKCRFLACPNIKVNCILCEVSMREYNHVDGNTTYCEIFDTSHLKK